MLVPLMEAGPTKHPTYITFATAETFVSRQLSGQETSTKYVASVPVKTSHAAMLRPEPPSERVNFHSLRMVM